MSCTTLTAPHRLAVALMSLSLPLLLTSCSSERQYDAIPTYPVTGRVLTEGEPAAGVFVKFTPLDALESPSPLSAQAQTGPDGTFSLSTYEKGDGAPVGRYAVTLTWPSQPANAMRSADPGPDRLRGRYADPKNAEWTIEVGEGENTLTPFEIEATRK